ncbi:hypothetical protein EYF80_013959 [Liparis tanakae]|uniref:Uncharacterized protein n=1 Tax=Liparis tanakae TaxID=230148 RepID=A0A4Z2IER6_9TELE|nr:hypothetical protein EYF80_013959 [Liparis tanakae]
MLRVMQNATSFMLGRTRCRGEPHGSREINEVTAPYEGGDGRHVQVQGDITDVGDSNKAWTDLLHSDHSFHSVMSQSMAEETEMDKNKELTE